MVVFLRFMRRSLIREALRVVAEPERLESVWAAPVAQETFGFDYSRFRNSLTIGIGRASLLGRPLSRSDFVQLVVVCGTAAFARMLVLLSPANDY